MATPSVAVSRPLHEDPEIHARRWFLLGIMCLSLVLVVMSVSGLNVALPTMQQELAASASELQWIVDAYAVLFAGLLLTAGAIGDRFGRREALLAGLGVFGVGAVVAGLATSASQVIAGRVVMGVGACHPVDHHRDLPAGGAAARDRRVGGIRGRGRIDRPDRVGRIAGRVLVGVDAARERADRRRRARGGVGVRARLA